MPITELLLPRTSDAMTEAVVSRWLVANETEVTRGTMVAEVETDKALVEVPADSDGLLVVAAPEGSDVPVGAVIAYLLDGPEVEEYRGGRLALGAVPMEQGAPSSSEPTPPPGPSPDDSPSPPSVPEAPSAADAGRALFSSPLARRMAREKGLSIEELHPGSGPNGRIVRADVLRAAQATSASAAPREMTSRQRSMVAAMVNSKAEIPHFYLFRDIDLGAVVEYRRALTAAGMSASSVSAILVRALGVVLERHEFARRRWTSGGVSESDEANVGVAVADGVDDIVVPVVRGPGRLSLAQVASELERLSEAVRSRTLRQADSVGAAATISNLGMHGVDSLLPIIPPGQSFILGVGRTRSHVVLDDRGHASSRSVATFSLAGDHRVLTGMGGARILGELDDALQHPLRLAEPGI